MNLADAAIRLGNNRKIMQSYWDFHTRKQNWFFSPNPNLAQATKKPPSFKGWKSWDTYTSKQKSTLAVLAGFHYNAKGIQRKNLHLSRLNLAFSKWEDRLYSVFWGNLSSHKIWLCNVFVGDAIYLYNKTNFTSSNKHYYDPRQILNGQTSLIKRNSYKEVAPGDIVVIGTGHVEIITSRVNHFIADTGFCSIGAGRGNNEEGSGNGQIKCDGFLFNATRELDNDNNTYFHL